MSKPVTKRRGPKKVYVIVGDLSGFPMEDNFYYRRSLAKEYLREHPKHYVHIETYTRTDKRKRSK